MNDRDAQTIAAAQQLHEAMQLVIHCLDSYEELLPMDWFDHHSDAYMAIADLIHSIVEYCAPKEDQRKLKDSIMAGDIIHFINAGHITELGLDLERFLELDPDEAEVVLESLSFEWQAEQLLILAPNLAPRQLATFATIKPFDRIRLMAIVIDQIKPRHWADAIAYILDHLQERNDLK